jgi:excisionase family DNA binding protein
MEPGSEEREYLKPLEAADLLRCGRTKIYEILQTGTLPSYRVGRNRIINRADVVAWLLSQRCEPGEGVEDLRDRW